MATTINGSTGASQIQDDIATTAKILDANITTAKILDANVTDAIAQVKSENPKG